MLETAVGNSLPIILLPGMAADGRLFRFQRSALPGLITPEWIEPREREPLGGYAARLAQSIEFVGPCVVGGASFGGMVALEMAAHVRAKACFLIASLRGPDELPWKFHALRPLARLGPPFLGQAASWIVRRLGSCLGGTTAGRLRRLSEPRSEFLRWAYWAVLTWQMSPEARRVPVYQIHGGKDRTFPVRCTRPDLVVSGAGHLLPLTHGEAVNDFIVSGVDKICQS